MQLSVLTDVTNKVRNNTYVSEVINSRTNRGSTTGAVGAAILLLADPLIKGQHLDVLQWAGYGLLIIGTWMYMTGQKRSKNRMLDELKELNKQIKNGGQNGGQNNGQMGGSNNLSNNKKEQ